MVINMQAALELSDHTRYDAAARAGYVLYRALVYYGTSTLCMRGHAWSSNNYHHAHNIDLIMLKLIIIADKQLLLQLIVKHIGTGE